MRCEICGTPLDGPGQAHYCRTDGPPPNPSAETFSLASRRVVRFAVVYAVVVAIISAVGYAALPGEAGEPVELTASTLILGPIAGLVGLVCLIGLLISTVVWIVSAHRLAAAGPGIAGYSGLILTCLLIALASVLPLRMPTIRGAVAAEAALRIGAVLVLLAGVLLTRNRLRRQTGQATLAGKPALITGDDWNASQWDPEVLRDIERRRGANANQEGRGQQGLTDGS